MKMKKIVSKEGSNEPLEPPLDPPLSSSSYNITTSEIDLVPE